MRLVVFARQFLSKSIFCHNEVTVQALFILCYFYFAIRDFRHSIMFLKMALDIFNTLENVSDERKAVRDFLCFYLRLPASPNSNPVAISDQDYASFENLLRLPPGVCDHRPGDF